MRKFLVTIFIVINSLAIYGQGGAANLRHGTQAQRPAACLSSRGEVYWQTDGATGLYLCKSNAWVLEDSDAFSQGLASARPAASSSNKSHHYFATDTNGGTLYVSTGSVWTKVGLGLTEVDAALALKASTADLASEASTRASADTTLQTNITSEASSRASADTTLQSNITSEASSRASADTSEATARANGDALNLAKASNLSDIANAGTARTNLGLGSLSTVSPTGTPNGTKYLRDDFSWQTITGYSDAQADARIAAAIGVSVEAYDSDLAAIAGLAPSNDDILQRKAGAWTYRTVAQYKADLAISTSDVSGLGTAATRNVAASGDAAAAEVVKGNDSRLSDSRTPLTHSHTAAQVTDFNAAADARVVAAVGVSVQAQDAELAALAGLTSAADKLPYFTGSGTAGLTTLTTFGRSLIDDADAATARSTIGLGSVVNADTTTTANITDSTNKRFVTDAQRTVIQNTSGSNSGDQSSVSGNAGTATALQTARNIDGQSFDGTSNITVIAPGTHAATGKTTPVDADEVPLVDSAASNVLKKLTWANLKATLKTYFDTLYQGVLGYTAENVANKDTDSTFAANSDTKYPSQKAVKTAVDAKQNALGYTPERVLFTAYSGANSGTGETTLATYTLPAGTLGADGQVLRITGFCALGATANTKTVRVYFGATQVNSASSTTNNTGNWFGIGTVIRTGATSQNAGMRQSYNVSGNETANNINVASPAETLSGAIVIKITGQSNAASNDVLLKSFIIELLN